MKKALLVGAGLIFALSALARSYSLTDQPWRLKPFAGEPAPARLKYEFDESSWISQQQPVGNIAELKVGERWHQASENNSNSQVGSFAWKLQFFQASDKNQK